MAEFAQFIALGPQTDDAFRLDHTNNTRTFNFDLADLNPARTVIMMFKVAMSGDDPLLHMRINDNVELSIDFTLNPPPGLQSIRSWHEIMGPHEGFKASNNVLTVRNQNPQSSVVTVSDIVFLYHAKTV
jgi:hypothetical protein